MCQAEFEKAKVEVDIVKNLILHHSEYDDIMKIIKENPYEKNKNKINNDIFFENVGESTNECNHLCANEYCCKKY